MTRPVIVGSGIAGLWAAWRLAASGRRCILLTKGALGDSASAWAQGGIAAALGPGDSPALHAADTLAAGSGLADPEAVRVLTTEGPDRIRDLLSLGAHFDRASDGSLRFGLEAAHSRHRILHADGDRTGAAMVRSLTAVVRHLDEIEVWEFAEVRRILAGGSNGQLPNRTVEGLELVRGDGSVEHLAADHVVLATGGVGQLYAVTTNPLGSTGDGWALAHEAGAELRDLEFLQFHPTALRLRGVNPAPLVSEAVRGAGALLVDWTGQRFAFEFDARGELAPRDIVARAVAYAVSEGGSFLDARGIADFAAQFPGIHAMLRNHGLDPGTDLIPVAPALHYAMGGVATDLDGRSSVPGLWAIGEVASTGVHGANRLASNSLLEGLVFADRTARALTEDGRGGGDVEWKGPAAAARHAAQAAPAGALAESVTADELAPAPALRQAMRGIMTELVGLSRTESSLERALEELADLEREVPPAAWRTRHQFLVATLIAHSALDRRESRGGHRRVDFPPADAPRIEPEPLGLD
jgi:L-aspartate oxidase